MVAHSFRVFISAVTGEFGTFRSEIARVLRRKGHEVCEQEHFRQGPGTLLEKLNDYIKECDAVIFLIGKNCGNSPTAAQAASFESNSSFTKYRAVTGNADASYTQWEYFLATHHRKHVYAFFATDEFTPDKTLDESPEMLAAQQSYIDWIKQTGKDRTSISNLDKLIEDVLVLPLPSRTRKDEKPIVPKSLRSFGPEDADYFLELLPGQRDGAGLPESVSFWKRKIESTNPHDTFRVGLLYGPSGCGKSSLMKAGLLPRLSADVAAIYIEATTFDTESRILQRLRGRFPSLPPDRDLVETLALVPTTSASKVVLVIDQFEQWLLVNRGKTGTDLVQGLKHCDGATFQAIVLVRQDFFLEAERFLTELGVGVQQDNNFRVMDLFDTEHAEKVLARFGRGLQKLPADTDKMSVQQHRFLSKAIAELGTDQRIVSVRLSLFAEMCKARPWTDVTLKEIGGVEQLGVTFLRETFDLPHSDPRFRQHKKAAERILGDLLPITGNDIKGQMKPRTALLANSGYAERPVKFDELIRLLDTELRLITPTDPTGLETELQVAPIADRAGVYYQLTHDYLVKTLRQWLDDELVKTRRGRASKRLRDRSASWNLRNENRNLPSLWEFLNVCLLTRPSSWTSEQRLMMARASKVHGIRLAAALTVLAVLTYTGLAIRNRVVAGQVATRIEGLVERLVDADPNQIPEIVAQLSENQQVSESKLAPLLTPAVENNERLSVGLKRAQLHARMAAVARDSSLVEPLLEDLLTAKVTYVGPIRELLKPYASQLAEKCSILLRDETVDTERRFRAALVLADYAAPGDSSDTVWSESTVSFVAYQLVSANAEFQPVLRNLLRPIHARLLPDLERVFGDVSATDAQRLSAANAFADYAASDIDKLSSLVVAATPEQYSVIYPLVAANPTPDTIAAFAQIAATLPSDDLGSVPRIAHGQRRANAAVTMLKLGEREKVLPVFEWRDDPEALTQFIFRCKPRNIGVETLLDLLELLRTAPAGKFSNNARYALLLAIGEYAPSEISSARRESIVKLLADWYANDPSSGVHGAAGWLLRHLGEQEIVTRVDQTPVPYSTDREWFTLAINVTPTAPPQPKTDAAEESKEGEANKTGGESDAATETNKEKVPNTQQLPNKTFYYTFIVVPPGEFFIGSPEDEPNRNIDDGKEKRHAVKLTRPFALLDREITMEELIAFKPMYVNFLQQHKSKPNDSGFGVNWYDSVGFCRWLGTQMGLPESDQAYSSPESLDEKLFPREPNPIANWAPKDWPLDLDRTGFRLATDAEWEVATRDGTRTAYSFGGDTLLMARFGWFDQNSGKKVHPSKELRPSSRGLFDVHGNLYEWTHDCYKGYSAESLTDPLESAGSPDRVGRSSGWNLSAYGCRTASRNASLQLSRATNLGIRLALTPSNPVELESSKGGAAADGVAEGASAEQQPKIP